ncbi:hypothetical protein D9Q98_006176 [Chlorella vulgaris]|uniref:Replication protein A C-terminal domain-containing protein n=1 Tax=Chlorella vulgaris TaxID=3077 RepID=A0A9D4TX22_CHLVU|nr:hypothetical protein D9Q98_006176 [Chlorella vulgaris]
MYGGGGDAGASQFNGAGFMPSQAGNAGGGGGSGKKNYDSKQQTLRAVTIRQLHEALSSHKDDTLMLDGKEMTNITLLGKVLSSNEQGLTYGLKIDDGTGRADVKIWISDDDSEVEKQRRAEWRPGMYVRIHGHISNFGKSQDVLAYNIRPVTDHNEVTYHYLQALHQHLHLTKGCGAGPAMHQEQAGAYGTPPVAAAGYGAALPVPSYDPHHGTSALDSELMHVLNAPDARANDCGVSIDDLLMRTGGRYSMVQVREACAKLADNGRVYSTLDENHFKTCE